jgi:hypothetical protein
MHFFLGWRLLIDGRRRDAGGQNDADPGPHSGTTGQEAKKTGDEHCHCDGDGPEKKSGCGKQHRPCIKYNPLPKIPGMGHDSHTDLDLLNEKYRAG